MTKLRRVLASGAGSWLVAVSLLAGLLPAVVDLHVLCEAPGVVHAPADGQVRIDRAVGVTLPHPKAPHAESTEQVVLHPCPACLLRTVHRQAPALAATVGRLPAAGRSRAASRIRRHRGETEAPTCRGPPAA